MEEPEEVLEVESGYWVDHNLVGRGEEHGIKEDSAAVSEVRGPVLANAILVLKPHPTEAKRHAEERSHVTFMKQSKPMGSRN